MLDRWEIKLLKQAHPSGWSAMEKRKSNRDDVCYPPLSSSRIMDELSYAVARDGTNGILPAIAFTRQHLFVNPGHEKKKVEW